MRERLRLSRSSAGLALLVPPLALFVMFFLAPLLSLLWASFHTASDTELYGPALTTAHYATILTDSFYHTIILRTLSTGAVILLLCLVLGYATAYVLAPLPPRRRLLLLALLVLPLMVSNVVRAYGWIAILGRQGLVNSLLRDAGVIERPLVLLNSFEAVSFGLMTILLPYMVISVDEEGHVSVAGRGYSVARSASARLDGANPFVKTIPPMPKLLHGCTDCS